MTVEPISKEDRARIKELLEKASPGNWEFDSTRTEDGFGAYNTYEITTDAGGKYCDVVVEFSNSSVGPIEHDDDGRWDEGARRNAAFIVEARTVLPKYEAALQAAEAKIAELSEALKPFAEVHDLLERNGYYRGDFDILARQNGAFIGHLGIREPELRAARAALSSQTNRGDADNG